METKIELTDPSEIEAFKEFCRYREQLDLEHEHWRQVREFSKTMQYGKFSLQIEAGIPKRIFNAMQDLVIKVRI